MHALRRMLPFVRPYRGLAVASLVALVAMVAFDLAIPRLVQRILDDGVARGDGGLVLRTAGTMLALSFVSMAVAVGNSVASVRVGEGFARDLREALFRQVQTWSAAEHERVPTGQLLVRLTSDVAAVKMLVQMSLRIGTRAPLLLAGSVSLMVRTSPRLALTMLPVLAVTVALLVGFVRVMEPRFLDAQKRLDALNAVLQENVAGVRLVRAFVRGATELARFRRANVEVTETALRVLDAGAVLSPALTMCVNIGVVVVIASGGAQSIAGTLTSGEVVAFSNYLLTAMGPLLLMTMLTSAWAQGVASAQRLAEVFEVVPAVRDAPEARALECDGPARVDFESVTFAYHQGTDANALTDVTLRIAAGETVALLGATGAGKSTLAALLARAWDPTAGRVLLDGHDLRTLTLASVAGAVATAPQEALLFAGTVRDNVAYGRPDARDEEVIAAATAAQAHGFIAAMADGYASRVQPRGANLSGGQRQRISLARALLARSRVLVLDDVTSAVDGETGARIHAALRAERRTTVLITQRVAAARVADRIVVLDNGRLVAEGTHDALAAESPVYREICASQGVEVPAV